MNRTSVLAQLARWVLWSRRRALGLVTSVLVGAIVVSRLLASTHSPATPAPPPPSSASTPAPPSTGEPVGIGVLPGGPPAGRSPETIAAEFASRWVHREDPTAWVGHLAPWCTPSYGSEVLPTIDPATVPATRVTGPARRITADQHTATVLVPLDAITLQVTLLNTADTAGDSESSGATARWRVNDASKVNADSAGSAR